MGQASFILYLGPGYGPVLVKGEGEVQSES